MKKHIFIFCALAILLGLTAFGVIQLNSSDTNELEPVESEPMAMDITTEEKRTNRIFTDFIYDIGPRFGPIKKADLDTIRSFNDIVGEEQANRITAYKSVSVILIINDEQSDIRETGTSGLLTIEQLKLLQESNYSTNFLIRADYTERNPDTGALEESYSTPHLTIVPEKQAKYSMGKDALKKFLKEQTEDVRADVIPEKLAPAKLFFTVTKEGDIDHIRLDRSSNYLDVDYRMMQLISKLPGTWEPSENDKGEKVDQELVVSFGLMGC